MSAQRVLIQQQMLDQQRKADATATRRHSPSDETGHGHGRDPGNAGSALSKTVIIPKV